MRGRIRLLAVGLVVLVVGVVAFFPAQIAYQWFAPQGVKLSGVSGSVWRGTAQEAMVNGIYVTDLTWRAAPLALATGTLKVDVAARPLSGRIESTVSAGVNGNLLFADLHGSLPLQALEQAVGIAGLRGSANVQFDRLILRNGLPVAADGVLIVSELVLPPVDRAPLGGYRADCFTGDAGVTASIEDTDGVVDLAGSFELSEDRSYRFVARLGVKSTTPGSIRQQLQFLGSPDERGQHELRLEGRL